MSLHNPGLLPTPEQLSILGTQTQQTPGNEAYQQLFGQYTEYQAVSSFVIAVLRGVLPKALLGTKENFKKLEENIRFFVRLRAFEKIPLDFVMQGMNLNTINWLAAPGAKKGHLPPTDYKARYDLLSKVGIRP